MMMVFPAAMAGPIFQQALTLETTELSTRRKNYGYCELQQTYIGEFHGMMAPHTPRGSRRVYAMPLGVFI